MRKEIAEAYERMQEGRAEVRFEPLPEHPHKPPSGAKASQPAADEDFELDAGFAVEAPSKREARSEDPATRRGASAFTGHGRGGAKESGASGSAAVMEAGSAEAKKTAGDADGRAAGGDSTADEAERRKKQLRGEESQVAHSEATGGDALLRVALQEERETGRRGRQTATDPVRVEGGWMITCPCPARVRIRVKETHRGKTGKCPNPNCGSYFTVPANLPMAEDEAAPASAATPEAAGFPADPAEKAGVYTHWLRDARLHVVKPAKARRKPSGHEKEAIPSDIGFSKADGVVILALASKPSGLLAKAKKPEQVRDDLLAELRAGKPIAELPTTKSFVIGAEALPKMIVEYPPAYEHESTFAGVPVFGPGYIAVKLPPVGAEDEQQFLALTLSQYRRLEELLQGLFEVDQLGFACPIPGDETVQLVCHYSEEPMQVLRNATFHLADPAIELEAVGYRCDSCGLIVSEDSRKKEKIGGLEGKKLASAKCPKCKGKFGNSPLYALKAVPSGGEATSDAPAEAPGEGGEGE